MNQGFIFVATTACLMLLAYLIQKAGSRPECGTYRFSQVFIGLMSFGVLFWAGLILYELHTRFNVTEDYFGLRSATWIAFGILFFFIFAVTYYPSVRFIIDNGTLTYKSIWTTKVIDLTQPFTLTCYPSSGQYVIRQGRVKTKITGYVSGWQYLLEEIEEQSTAMEKIEKNR